MAVRKHGVLSANTVKSEDMGAADDNDPVVNQPDADEVEVAHIAGTSPIYFTVNGVDPTVRGDDTYAVQAGGSYRVDVRGEPPVTVKMICATADTYAVELFTA